MGPLRREMAMTMSSHDDGSRGPVLGGETASLLDAAPSAPSARDPFSRAFETGGGGGGGGGYTGIEEHTRGSPQDFSLDVLHSYHGQPLSSSYPLASLPQEGNEDISTTTTTTTGNSSSGRKNNPKTRFPSLTPPSGNFSPAPGNFSGAGDTRAAEAVAHARKTWAPPALRTQAIASYGAVPDLEIIPEGMEVNRFQKRQRVRRYSDLGCPTCAIS